MLWIIIGLLIVTATFWLIIKSYETRLVLFLSGALTAVLGKDPGGAVNAVIKQFVNGGPVPTIRTVLGFSYVMTYAKCSDHLVAMMTNILKRVPLIILPDTVIVTFLLNIASRRPWASPPPRARS